MALNPGFLLLCAEQRLNTAGDSPLISAESLRSRTSKELGQMAKKKGVQGWHSMKKDELVRALLRKARAKAKENAKAKSSKNGAKKKTSRTTASRNGHAKKSVPARKTSPRIVAKVNKANAAREVLKSLGHPNGNGKSNGKPRKDRVILMVRDAYWLHAHWEIARTSVERVRAAMAENWHTAKPTLRLVELEDNGTTNTTEKVVRDITIHGGVNNWYVDVHDPPKTYQVMIGYLAENGKFHGLVRSNIVKTPRPGSADTIDENWTDVAENYEKIYAMSGGYDEDTATDDLQELFEERLRRPMGSPLITKYGVGAEGLGFRNRDFEFEVEAEMIIYGTTKPDAYVTLSGEPVRLRPDGTFTVRLDMPDRRQVLPVVSSSNDGVEQRTVVIAVERNTKVMEPMIRDPNE